MEKKEELEKLARTLKELRKRANALFADMVELRLNRELIREKQEELDMKNQHLIAIRNFLVSESRGCR